MTIQPPRPSLVDSVTAGDPLHCALQEAETWRERARSAERRAQFAELRLRAMEVRVNALARHVTVAKSHRSRLPRLRTLRYLLASELKEVFSKIVRKISKRIRK
jgi:hypothetical protein